MKILTIGDTHGKNVLGHFNVEDYDKVVFLGDYVDAFDKTDQEIIINLQNIIQLKKDNPDKVCLLIGNHCLQYIHPEDPNKCSGYRPSCALVLQQIFSDNRDLFQMAYLVEDYLFTHAGLSNFWWNNFVQRSPYFEYMTAFNLAEVINELSNSSERWKFNDDSGPLWIRPWVLSSDLIYGYHQVVGHTRMKDITRVGDDKTSVTYCDVLDNKMEFLSLEI